MGRPHPALHRPGLFPLCRLRRSPQWDFLTLDFDRDITAPETLDHHRIDALDPNLKPFFARGGKLIQYHGWSDGQISPGNSVNYYRSVTALLGNVDDSYRLFMVPGMGHCGGGEGATSFNALPALEQWLEQKRPPARIVAARKRDGQNNWTHPLCPFPKPRFIPEKAIPRMRPIMCVGNDFVAEWAQTFSAVARPVCL